MKNSLTVIMILIGAVCFAQTDERQIWSAFVDWLKTPESPENPAEIVKAYSSKLESSGLAPGETKSRLDMVLKRIAVPGGEFTNIIFNKIYASSNPQFNTAPSAFLARAIRDLRPGKALDVAMGQGRNSIYLALQGWDVTGYDVADGGLEIARAAAARAGVKIKAVLNTHSGFDFGNAQWDLIAMIYPGISMDDKPLLDRVRAGLRPGGVIVVEQFNAPPDPGAKGPANALFKTFQDYRVVRYEDVVDIRDWGKVSARIGRLEAIKEE